MPILLTLLRLQVPDEFAAGVKRIAAPGSPGPVCAFGDRAFPAIAGGRAAVVAAVEDLPAWMPEGFPKGK